MAETCPNCGLRKLHPGRIKENLFGVDLGMYDGEVCDACGESFLSTRSVQQIEAKAKELGLWGLSAKVKIVKSGNSLVVRIPASLAKYLNLRRGQEVMVSPDRDKGLVLELA